MKVFLINLFKYSYYEVYLQIKSNLLGNNYQIQSIKILWFGFIFFFISLISFGFNFKIELRIFHYDFFHSIFCFKDKLINFENIETEINQFYLNNSLHRTMLVLNEFSYIFLILTLIFIF